MQFEANSTSTAPHASTSPRSVPAIAGQAFRHIDHVTYSVRYANADAWITRWRAVGFREHVRLQTYVSPATHIALVAGAGGEYPWETMTGLSCSEDPESPINKFIDQFGEGPQHIAYNIHPEADMDLLLEQLVAAGWNFMTPVLTYKNDDGACLRQIFTAPTCKNGPFMELVQRLADPQGRPYDGFDTQNIENLYAALTAHSQSL